MNFVALILAILTGCAHAQVQLPSEYIDALVSDITITPDGAVDVRETITYVNQNIPNKHGITRSFPTRYTGTAGTNYTITFVVKELLREGKPEPYSIQHGYEGDFIKIGDANVVIPPGRQTYTITYHTERQLGFFETYDALYWNVVGSGSNFMIRNATALVHLPSTIDRATVQHVAFTGPKGSAQQHYRSSLRNDGTVEITTTQPLQPHEAFTIKVSWPKGLVLPPTAWQEFIAFARDNAALITLIITLLFCTVWYLRCRRVLRQREAKLGGTIIPLFYPPASLSPGAVRYVVQAGYDARQFAAETVAMAVAGIITIDYKKEWLSGTYRIEKKRDIRADDLPLQRELTNTLFEQKEVVELGTTNKALLTKTSETLKDAYTKEFQHLFEHHYRMLTLPTIAMLCSMFIIFATDARGTLAIFALLLYIFVLGIGVYIVGSYTAEGCILRQKILGFKLFLGTTETERMAVIGTPPTRTPELYETYLPFAIALGVEKAWSAQFAPVFAELEQRGEPYAPLWYHGPEQVKFDSDSFSSQVSDSLQSSSESSGSGGRSSGSAGGGRGGGGIGSW